MLAEDGVLQPHHQGYTVSRTLVGRNAAARCDELLTSFPETKSELQLLRRCGAELARVLRGEQDPLPLLFAGDSFTDLRNLYTDSPYARTYNGMLADLVQRATARSPDKRPIRVLEIGAGTGGTTRYVLPILGPTVEYTFTDVSPLFLAQATERFREYPLLRTGLLDIERDPSEQGFEAGGFDIVIAANVLHATADLHQTMTHVGHLLAPGGILFVAEGLVPEQWVNITFGLTDGWWRVTDIGRRPTDPLLGRDGWRALLAEVGFTDVVVLPDEDRAVGCAAHQALIMAIWPGNKLARRWLILADESDLAQHLEVALVAAGNTVTVLAPETWRPVSASAEVLRRQAWWPGAAGSTGSAATVEIVYLGALDSGEGAKAAPELSSRVALTLLQGAAAVPAARLWLVTRGAQDIRGPSDIIAPEQAAVWGLGRTFAREQPFQWGGLLDLDPLGDTKDAVAAFMDATRADDGEDQVAWRDGMRRVARLVSAATPARGSVSLRSNVSYLVTGGLGGIGLQIADWLAARGARHLVLAGRTPLPPRRDWTKHTGDARIAAVTKLEGAGVTVNTLAVDVSDPAAMADAMARFGQEWPPLGGIVHAAVALTAWSLADMPHEELEAMFRTKVHGARLLDALSASQPVEFFVSFSTTAALLGQAQFAHYAASNAVLDALACRHRANGRQALSINWGTWNQMWGLNKEDRARIARAGVRPMPARVALAALESLIAAGATRAIVADVDWPVLRAVYESRRAQPMLSRVVAVAEDRSGARSGASSAPGEQPATDYASLAPSERRHAIEHAVRREVAQVVGLCAPDLVDPALSLFKMGMDSLMAIELKRRLEHTVAATLPSALAFNYPTVTALVDFLDAMVAEREQTSVDDVEDASELLSRVPEMSSAEVDFVLGQNAGRGRQTVSELGADHKRQLLTRLLQERDAQQRAAQVARVGGRRPHSLAAAGPPLRQVSRAGDLELSFAQEMTWFLEQLRPEALAYNVLERFRFIGRLDVELLRRSIEAVVSRHEVLRTTYPTVDGRPVQRIEPPAPWSLRFVDLRGRPAQDRDDEARRLIATEAKERFDLAAGPLLRTTLLQLAEDDYVLAITVHHIAVDGWSLRLLMRELTTFYSAFVEGHTPTLPNLPVQYADFAQWQRQWLTGEVLARHRDYWRKQLGTLPPKLKLPTDYVRQSVRTFAGACHYAVVPRAILSGLRDLSRREGVTLFTALLAAFSTLIMRYTGQEDFVMGSVIAGRIRPEIEHALGFFANIVALRTDLSGNPTFQEVIARTRDVVFGAHANEAFPFQRLVEEFNPERGVSINPFTQVALNLLNYGRGEEISLPGIQVSAVGGLDVHAVADGINLFVSESPEQLDLCYAYGTELFKAATIERMSDHFLTLLGAIVTDPGARLWDLPLLSDTERTLIEKMSAATGWSAPADVPLHGFFETQVETRPDAIAVTCDGQHLSYAELNSRANSIARRLRSMGVGPDAIVGLCVERSLDLVIGILGILKAGGAYVPLDPEDTKERLAFFLVDTGATTLVTHRAAQAALPDLPNTGILLLEDVLTAPEDGVPRLDDCVGGAGPDNLACVIYTSGSTGQPKGVLITHANVGRLLTSTDTLFHFGPDDVWTLFHSFASNFFAWEFWGALARGGRLVVVPFVTSRDPQAFLTLLALERVTVLNQTPSTFSQLTEADRASNLSNSIRLIICGGEALDFQSLRRWFERHGDTQPRLVNMYGTTETCGHVTYRSITRQDVQSEGGSPIGVPLPNMSICLLDSHGHLAPFGLPGEIYVRAPGLAKGYLNRPDLTAQHFVPDPACPGECLYRSGDLARRLPDGQLEFLGRIDPQIKIRGFPVELGEIELALAEYSAIRQAIVVIRPSGNGDRLVACVTLASGSASLASDEVRAHLRRKLPPYMLPDLFEILPALPLNRNGKLDRQALALPAAFAAQSSLRPLTTTEEQVAMSLDPQYPAPARSSEEPVERLVRRLQSLGLRLTLEDDRLKVNAPKGALTDAIKATIGAHREDIIRALRAGDASQDTNERKLQHASREPPLPLTAVQRRFWFLDRIGQGEGIPNVAVAMRLEGDFDLAAMSRALAIILDRHETLRIRIGDRDGEPYPEIAAPTDELVRVIDLSEMPESERVAEGLRLSRELMRLKFALVDGPLARTLIVRLAPNINFLTISMHHIVGDGWSSSILMRELEAVYKALTSGHAPDLPPVPFQYIDYAAWEAAQVRAGLFDRQLAYWTEKLAHAPAALALPNDRPRPPLRSFRGSRVDCRIEPGLVQRLQQFSQQHDTTLFMTILAAWAVVLHRLSGQDDVVIGTPVANRGNPDLERIVGPFVNSLALRLDLAANPNFARFLEQVRRTTIDAIDNRELPFDMVVEAVNPARTLDHAPIFQVMFALHNFPLQEPSFQGLKGAFITLETQVARFDLMLDMAVHQGTLFGAYEYDTDLFDHATIERMHHQLVQVLNAILIDETKPIRDLPLRSAAEDRILDQWNDTAGDHDRGLCAHQLFEHAARLIPDSPAVTAGGETLSYREIEEQANRLARFLQRRGVGRGHLVAICLDRTIELPVAMIAVLKAGAAYVPLDPTHPSDRLHYMLEDAGVTCVLTVNQFGKALERPEISQIHLDEITSELEALQTASPKVEVQPEDLAYVIYTSGSTGRPKGVQVEHRNLVNFLNAMRLEPGFKPTDVLLAITTPSFDIAGLEIWLPVSFGGRVVVASRADTLDGKRLIELLEQHRINVMQATPTTWRLLLAAGWTGKPDLKALCGGEAMPRDLATALVGRVAQLWNMYGPTETTIWSTAALVDDPSRPPSIGRPIANTRLYVIESSGMPAPIGAFGELLIGGEGVARGYWNCPDLTAEKFVMISLPDQRTERVYRTGDVVRFRSDGQLDFQGRRDHQIKMRGYRIELEEIEAVLGSHPGVRECVVIIREDEPGDQRLVGYVVARPGSPFDPDAARSTLRAKLPAYMVPSALVTLSSLPLTPNGKINRKALPIPEETVALPTSPEVVMSPVQCRVAEIWRDVLKIKRVSLHDNFFDAGGHSMMVVKLHDALNREFGSELTLTDLFQQTTVAMQANRLSSVASSDAVLRRAQARARSQLHG